jgi:BTB/POZ domain
MSPKMVLNSLEFVCHHSPVLKAAFNSNFMEGETQTYRLEEISSSAFRLLVQWFYNEEFDVFKEEDLNCANDEDDPEVEKLWADQDINLIQLWIVADKLLIRPLQNAVINVLEEFWEEPFVRHGGPSTSWIPYAYEHTTAGSPLRNFATDICAYKISPEGFAAHPDDFPKEVLLDMAMVLSKAVSIWRHDDVTNSDDEEEEHSDDLISDSDEDEEEGEGVTGSATIVVAAANNNNAGEGEGEDSDQEMDNDGEDGIWLDDEDEYFIGDVPELPRYQCHRTWRTYLVAEDEE